MVNATPPIFQLSEVCMDPSTTRPRGFTWEQRDLLWKWHREGVSRRTIATRLGKLPGSIHEVIRRAGGLAPRPRIRSNHHLSLEDRQGIERALARGDSYRTIARWIGCAPSTISREVTRHGGRAGYDAVRADIAAWEHARRPKVCRLATRRPLRRLIERKLRQQWSPRQISRWLRLRCARSPELQVSHETIYRSLYIQSRNVLRAELTQELRRRRRVRVARTATRKGQGRGQIVDAISISERPAEAADRAVPGHWEGDLIAGRNNSYIATLVERATRFVVLVKMPSKETTTVVPALIRQIKRLPAHLKRSLTWDRGTELAHHRAFSVATGVQVYFCDPQSPWQRGSNENTNGLLRQYFPRKLDLSTFTQRQLDAVADGLNGRPRETLGFETPAEVIARLLR
jgi:IS30 family transposase